MGLLRGGGSIAMNRTHLIGYAKRHALQLVAAGYVPPERLLLEGTGDARNYELGSRRACR
jgi:hypothetical protein